MIALDLASVTPTVSLTNAQAALAGAADDAAGRRVVAERSAKSYTSMSRRLADAQLCKCAYCEDYLRKRMIEVDHIRPKDSASPSGYWWLAYSRQNLVATCRSCNNAKNNRWQIRHGTRRLRPREDPRLVVEFAMLVDPTVDDPDLHITWVYAGGLWRISSLTDRGRWSINALELDRDCFLFESNEYILDVFDPRVDELEAAVAAGDRSAFVAALARLDELAAPVRRWAQMARILRDHAIAGTYVSPLPLV